MQNDQENKPTSNFIRRVMPHASERMQREAEERLLRYFELGVRIHKRVEKEQGPDYIKNYCLDCQSESFINLLKNYAKKKESENDSVEPRN